MDRLPHSRPGQPVSQPPPASDYDQLRLQRRIRELQESQNFGLGLLGGIGGAALGATLWAVITAATNFQIGWMAVGVGFLVGYGIRTLGRGVEPRFGYMGAALSLLGCIAGNLLMVCIVLSSRQGVPLLMLLSRLDLQVSLQLLQATFHPLDLLFYGLAIYEGYRLSFSPIKGMAPPGSPR